MDGRRTTELKQGMGTLEATRQHASSTVLTALSLKYGYQRLEHSDLLPWWSLTRMNDSTKDDLRALATVRAAQRASRTAANRPERERNDVTTFLRCLGVDFAQDEVISSSTEPPDVNFRDARIEHCEAFPADRRIGDELKRDATAIEETLQVLEEDPEQIGVGAPESRHPLNSVYVEAPSIQASLLSQTSLNAILSSALESKCRRYAQALDRAQLDCLVSLMHEFALIDTVGEFEVSQAIKKQGWRSVSFFKHPVACVAHVTKDAPEFLRSRLGSFLMRDKEAASTAPNSIRSVCFVDEEAKRLQDALGLISAAHAHTIAELIGTHDVDTLTQFKVNAGVEAVRELEIDIDHIAKGEFWETWFYSRLDTWQKLKSHVPVVASS
ncbi:MAG: DUF1780 domain-containing protein [Bdellovibrionota bacterium]